MMTRKDYNKVAEILLSNKGDMSEIVFSTIVDQFSDLFFYDNKNFSPMRFELACYGDN